MALGSYNSGIMKPSPVKLSAADLARLRAKLARADRPILWTDIIRREGTRSSWTREELIAAEGPLGSGSGSSSALTRGSGSFESKGASSWPRLYGWTRWLTA